MYIASYVLKAENGVSEMLKKLAKELEDELVSSKHHLATWLQPFWRKKGVFKRQCTDLCR